MSELLAHGEQVIGAGSSRRSRRWNSSPAVTHRHVMHGWLWCWHRSHHEPRRGAVETNDLFAVAFAVPSIALIYAGANGHAWALPVGLGMLRARLCRVPRRTGASPAADAAGRRPVSATHRAGSSPAPIRTREEAVRFGFLVAPESREIRRELREQRARKVA